MTVAEMHTAFKIGLDKSDTLSYPNFEPEERDFWLNKGQERFIKQRYGINNPKRQSFEETQKRTDDLRQLVTDLNELPIDPVALQPIAIPNRKPNSYIFILPPNVALTGIGGSIVANTDTYWFAINEECTITYTDCNNVSATKRISVRPISHDNYSNIIDDPFNSPDQDEAIRLMQQNFVEIITDGTYSVERYFIRYIRKPRQVSLSTSVNSELPDHTHQEIVDLAVLEAIENVESQRYQTATAEVVKQE